MYQNLAILAVFAFLFSVVAGRVERSFVTGPRFSRYSHSCSA
jgi:hypothetical protein